MFSRNPAGQSSLRKFRQERRVEMRASWRSLVFFVGLLIVCAYFVIRGSGAVQTFAAFALGAGLTALLFGWMLGFNARTLRWAWGAAGELFLLPEASGRGRTVPSSKIFEYLAAERPILAAVPPGGEAGQLPAGPQGPKGDQLLRSVA